MSGEYGNRIVVLLGHGPWHESVETILRRQNLAFMCGAQHIGKDATGLVCIHTEGPLELKETVKLCHDRNFPLVLFAKGFGELRSVTAFRCPQFPVVKICDDQWPAEEVSLTTELPRVLRTVCKQALGKKMYVACHGKQLELM